MARIACISSSDSSKSNTCAFAAILCGLLDFGMQIVPLWMAQRTSTCTPLFLCASAILRMTGSFISGTSVVLLTAFAPPRGKYAVRKMLCASQKDLSSHCWRCG